MPQKIPTYIIGGSKQTVVYRMAQAKQAFWPITNF